MKYKICDTAFPHAKNMGWHWKSKFGIEWYRGPDYYDTCFFTDNELSKVDSVACKKKIAIVIEPPAILGSSNDYIKNNHHKFDYILTYNRDLLKIDPKRFLFCPQDPSWIPEEDRRIYEKSKRLSIVASYKKEAPGHKLRHQIIEKFKGQMDVYGCGFGEFKHPKTPMLCDHMFSMAVMNSNHDDYFTEILTDTFACGTVPIFWGTHNIGNYFNADGIIQFDTLDELECILETLTIDLYMSKMDAIKENFNKVNDHIVVEDYLYKNYKFLFE